MAGTEVQQCFGPVSGDLLSSVTTAVIVTWLLSPQMALQQGTGVSLGSHNQFPAASVRGKSSGRGGRGRVTMARCLSTGHQLPHVGASDSPRS